ncbi:MAG: TetR/AcrR family transcriptional regulator [Actinomycetota bacterium]|nr:TetR/AcrR family transcriptional regulator [Actinomycetota bacterium]
MSEAAIRRKPGPKPRFTQDDLVDAALAVVDSQGFKALSLRAVARELGVTSMAIYTYVGSREELYGLVVDRLISTKLAGFVWPELWPEALRMFAGSLSELIDEHHALIEAFAEGQMRTELAASVADHMLQLLLDGGLPLRGAGVAYAAMHALVLGHAVLREAERSTGTPGTSRMRTPAHSSTPTLAEYAASKGRPAEVALQEMLGLLIAGIEHNLNDTAGSTPPR